MASIPFEIVEDLLDRLRAYRKRGESSLIQHDERDKGNYFDHADGNGGYAMDAQFSMLQEHDPTGFAAAFLLHELVETTMRGATVRLERVLREPGYVDRLHAITAIHAELEDRLAAPRAAFMARVRASLAAISESYPEATTRQVVICLRDAVYSLSRGLTLRWLECGPAAHDMNQEAPLATKVLAFARVGDFQEALQHDMPYGACLASVGGRHTAIGIKLPGRIGFLSSLQPDARSGRWCEERARDYLQAEPFDLGRMAERYPAWTQIYQTKGDRRPSVGLPALKLSALPFDRVLWFALTAELARQRMLDADAASVSVIARMVDALPTPFNDRLLPALRAPAWTVEDPPVAEIFESLAHSTWVRNLLIPALDGLSHDHLLRIGSGHYALNLDDKTIHDLPADTSRSPGAKVPPQWVTFPRLSDDLSGSRDEIQAFRRAALALNLDTFLMAWLQRRIVRGWLDGWHHWFRSRLASRLPDALGHSCVSIKRTTVDYDPGAILFVNRSKKHKTFRPQCWFNPKVAPDYIATVAPRSSSDLLGLLGLDSEEDLPADLRGMLLTEAESSPVGGPYRHWPWHSLSAAIRETGIEPTKGEPPIEAIESAALAWRTSGPSRSGLFQAYVFFAESSVDTSIRNKAPLLARSRAQQGYRLS